MNLFFWRRGRSLAEHLAGKPKKIRVDTVDFVIRKINLLDHAAGLNIVMQVFSAYEKNRTPKVDQKTVDDIESIKIFMRDFIFAGVVEPRLTMSSKEIKPGEIHVDEILKDFEMSQKLFQAIFRYSLGKKKRPTTRSRVPAP